MIKKSDEKSYIFSKIELHTLLARKCVSLGFTITASRGVIVKLIIEKLAYSHLHSDKLINIKSLFA